MNKDSMMKINNKMLVCLKECLLLFYCQKQQHYVHEVELGLYLSHECQIIGQGKKLYFLLLTELGSDG